jgi:hypothetical protein
VHLKLQPFVCAPTAIATPPTGPLPCLQKAFIGYFDPGVSKTRYANVQPSCTTAFGRSNTF